MHPPKHEFFIFQDGNTGSHEKASQGVGIEKAVFTSSKRRIFIFFITGQSQKAAECRAARPAERSVHRGLGFPQQAESTAPGIAGYRAFEALYYKDTACKRLKNVFGVIFTLFRKQCQHIYVVSSACWDNVPNPLNSPCRGWLRVRKIEHY